MVEGARELEVDNTPQAGLIYAPCGIPELTLLLDRQFHEVAKWADELTYNCVSTIVPRQM